MLRGAKQVFTVTLICSLNSHIYNIANICCKPLVIKYNNYNFNFFNNLFNVFSLLMFLFTVNKIELTLKNCSVYFEHVIVCVLC